MCQSFWATLYIPKYQINRMQHKQNSLARTVVQAPKFQNVTPILKSLHWLKVSKRIEYKIISLTKVSISLSHPISMTSYLCSVLTVTTHALHLMLLWSNNYRHSKSLIDPSDMLHLIYWTSCLHHSEFLIRITHPPLSDLHLNMPVKLATHCYHLRSLFHCFTLSSKPTSLENLILQLSLFLSVGLISWL